MKTKQWVERLSELLFGYRKCLLACFLIITVLFGYSASFLRIDASFKKMIPLEHPYMQIFTHYQQIFGGANRIVVALRTQQGDIYTPDFFKSLKSITDDVYFIPGIDRPTVTSLFTPNVRFIEVVENGFAGGNVIPANFQAKTADFETVRSNVLKSGQIGKLVSGDFKGALVSAQLQEINPDTGQKLDYTSVAKQLENIRMKYQNPNLDIHIIGFAKAMGDVALATQTVQVFFLIAFVLTTGFLYFYTRCVMLTGLALMCATIPVIWLLGLLPLIGLGIDPMSILVPFLIFSIGVSHAVQMTHTWQQAFIQGQDSLAAAKHAFVKLFIPGAMALLANALGFMVMILIHIDTVREMAITASLGVCLMVITNKMLLTVLLSYIRLPEKHSVGISTLSLPSCTSTGTRPLLLTAPASKAAFLHLIHSDRLWRCCTVFAKPRPALIMLGITTLLLGAAAVKSRQLTTGDSGKGIPELRIQARYNQDAAAITTHFSMGVDVLSIIAQSKGIDSACTNYDIMNAIDDFESHMKNVEGVQSTLSLAGTAKILNAGWNEGNPRWRVLSRNRDMLAQSVTPIDTATGLFNTDCSAMQVLLFTRDHRGTTLAHIVQEAKRYIAAHPDPHLDLLLAAGNMGVMAATNEAVDTAETMMLMILFGAIGLLCFLEFRSIPATLCIIVPLAVSSVMCNALMAWLGIGLKVSTLPVIALGVGVGVDYGIYLYAAMKQGLETGQALPEAFYNALKQRGTAIVFTAFTLAVGVATWRLSALKFQADMGILLSFMFLINMLGAVFLLPALAAILLDPSDVSLNPAQPVIKPD